MSHSNKWKYLLLLTLTAFTCALQLCEAKAKEFLCPSARKMPKSKEQRKHDENVLSVLIYFSHSPNNEVMLRLHIMRV